MTVNPSNGQDSLSSRLVKTTSKIIRFFGDSFIKYSFDGLPSELFEEMDTESVSLTFITQSSDGLIWFWKDGAGQKMHISLKAGSLYFVNDDSRGSPQQVRVQHPDSRVVNDFRWHTIRVEKNGRELTIFLDEQLAQTVTSSRDIQFITRRADVYLAGTADPRTDTTGLVNTKFDGALVDVESKKSRGPNKEIIISFLQQVGQATGNITIIDTDDWNSGRWTWGTTSAPPTPAARRPTPVTFKTGNSMFFLSDALDMRSGGTVSYRFRTIEPSGLLSIARGSGVQFFAMEVYDGILYFVYEFGSLNARNMFSDRRVDDGEWHEVMMRVDAGSQGMTLALDGRPFTVPLSYDQLLSLYFFKMYFGGYDNYRNTPWPLYARKGYRGCLESLQVNDIGYDLHMFIRNQRMSDVETGCASMLGQCQAQPCDYGFCRDRMSGYVCDCADTPYTGRNCNENAAIARWDGSFSTAFNFVNRDVTHTNDLSVRFNTPLKDTLLFRTETDSKGDYIQAELDDGRLKITFLVDGQSKTFVTGSILNDYLWHTMYIRRRADDVQIWLDDEPRSVGVIGGENYNLYIDRIKFGSIGETGELRGGNYIGYMQNFVYDGQELFGQLKGQSSSAKWIFDLPFDLLPLLTYKPITVTSDGAFFQLPSMTVGRTLKIMFKFKTRESNGLILYNSGIGSDVIAIELSDGHIRFAFNLGAGIMHTVVPTRNLNDNTWHDVQVALSDRGQFTVRVDGETVQVSNSNRNTLSLNGMLYIGGMPTALFSRPEVTALLDSRKGFLGCLASVDLNGAVPDLVSYASDKTKLLNGCTDQTVQCQPNACGPGVCVPRVNDFWCDCNMTGLVGIPCTTNPNGYYFGKNGQGGVVVYEFPQHKQVNSNTDMLAFGFKTLEKDGVLYRIESSLDNNEYIEIRLENGTVVAEANTGSGLVRLVENSRVFNDGQYHVVRYIRTGGNSTLQVDQLPTQLAVNKSVVSLFNSVYRVMLGGRIDSKGAIIRNFYGIIGGAYYNGHRWLDLLLSNTALHGKLVNMRGDVVLTKTYLLLPGGGKTSPVPPDLIINPAEKVPVNVGGGAEIGTGVGGVGDGGTPPRVPSFGETGGHFSSLGSGISVGAVPHAAPVEVTRAGGPIMPGARAGAVVGTVLGTMAFLTSLMWALYKLKPGVPTFLSPGAGAAEDDADISISSPRPTSNLGAVKAASAGAGGAGGEAGGAGAGALTVTVVDGSAADGGGAGGGNSTYLSYIKSTSTSISGGGAGGGAGAGGAGGADVTDFSTLMSTVTFSNIGTAIGSPTADRRITSSSYSSNLNYQSNTMQSYGSGGGTMDRGYTGQELSQFSAGDDDFPDYDIPLGGTGEVTDQSYSFSTLNTNYNYQVQNLKTVTMNKQGQYVMSSANGGFGAGAVTPGDAVDEVRVDCCLIPGDERSVVTGSSLGPPQVWDMQTGELQHIMKGDTIGSTNLHLVCGDRLLVGAVHADMEINEYSSKKGVFNHTLQIWDFQTGRPLAMAVGEYCSALCPMNDSDKVLFGRTDKFGDATSIIAWDLMGNQMIKEMRYDAPVGNNDYISFLNISKNDRYIIAGFTNSFDNDTEFMTFDMTLTSYIVNEPAMLKLDANPEVTVILPKDEALTGLRNGDLVVWSLQTAQPNRQLLGSGGAHAHTREVKSVTLSDDGRYLVSGSADGTLKVWDMHTERPIHTLQGHTDEVWCTALSSDNEIAVSGSADGTIRLWHVKNGTETCVFNCGVDIFYVTMSRDKGTIVALGDKYGARKLIMLQVVRSKIKMIVSS
ncbi:neurexin-1-like isoform X2 [Mya arenaria]|nr:neurexin-1-like isoform X2 [Mya arenaria]